MRLSRRLIAGIVLTAVVAVTVITFVTLHRSKAATAAPVFAEGGVATRGADPVSYFTDGRPLQGDPAIHADWMSARWLFASEEHRALFVANPGAYAPQFGGCCAWAGWEQDVPGNISRANGNWPGLKG